VIAEQNLWRFQIVEEKMQWGNEGAQSIYHQKLN